MEQIVVELEVGKADGRGDGDDDRDDDPEPGFADHVGVPSADEVPGGVAGVVLEFGGVEPAIAQNEDGREDNQTGRDAEDHAEAGDDAEFGEADKIVEAEGEEGGGGGATAGDDGDAGMLEGIGDGLVDAAAVAQFFFIAAENLDAEVDADAENHGDDGDGKDVEVANRDEGKGEGPKHGHDEDKDGEGGAQEGAIAEKEEGDDQSEGDGGRQRAVGVGLLGLVGVQGGFAGEFDVGAGIFGGDFDQLFADGCGGVAEGRGGILFAFAGVGENEDGLAVLEAEVLVLGDHLVGVGAVGIVGIGGVLGDDLADGFALGLGGDLVEDGDELLDERGEVLPVLFFVEIGGVVKFLVGLGEDGVEIERHLLDLLVLVLGLLLDVDLVSELLGDFLELLR